MSTTVQAGRRKAEGEGERGGWRERREEAVAATTQAFGFWRVYHQTASLSHKGYYSNSFERGKGAEHNNLKEIED